MNLYLTQSMPRFKQALSADDATTLRDIKRILARQAELGAGGGQRPGATEKEKKKLKTDEGGKDSEKEKPLTQKKITALQEHMREILSRGRQEVLAIETRNLLKGMRQNEK